MSQKVYTMTLKCIRVQTTLYWGYGDFYLGPPEIPKIQLEKEDPTPETCIVHNYNRRFLE